MRCKNPERCSQAAVFRLNRLAIQQEQGEAELEAFRQALEENKAALLMGDHGISRQLDRGYFWRHIADTVKYGWVLERRYEGSQITLLLMSYVKELKGRPCHVVVTFREGSELRWTVKTVYDPTSQSYKWADNYQRRVCFCS